MLGRFAIWRHLVVLFAIVVSSVLALLGLIGSGGGSERFDSKQITVSPVGRDGVRVREVVDEDFGFHRRHGYERIIPNDFGGPHDVTASSPDANADVELAFVRKGTRIRLGDPNTTYTDQHRYVLTYTLPDARLSTGTLNLDIIGPGEKFGTGRFEVIVTGLVLDNPTCNVGRSGTVGGCTLAPVGNDYRVVFTPLEKSDGVTIGGTIVGFTNVVELPLPALPGRRRDHRQALALAMIPIGLFAAMIVYVADRRRGRNEVFAGGAAEAAYGRLAAPGAAGPVPNVATRLVPDSKMDDLATTEFVPPKGIDPWHGAVLLGERINNSTVSAWFSALAATDAITLGQDEGKLVVGVGRRRSELDPSDGALVDEFMNGRTEVHLGEYDSHFASAWKQVKQRQGTFIKSSGWWRNGPPKPDGRPGGGPLGFVVAAGALLLFFGGSVASALFGVFHLLPLALIFGLVVPAVAALCVYATLLPARSATGSALSLLTESFRRFLVASEGQHVEWAWKQGVLREYSAWAVALGAAAAWGTALEHSNVAATEFGSANPLLVYSMASSFSNSYTAPSNTGSGGSSGFSGGGVGGGGGGGSSGSW